MRKKKTMSDVWAIVLAAGMSRRMHTQKLLLPWDEKTIIAAVVENIFRSGISNIMVVLGSHSAEVRTALSSYQVSFCLNDKFREGMFSSVVCGFSALPGNAEAALLFLGDQPFIPEEVPGKVIEKWQETRKGIIIPIAEGKRGHPSLFDLKYREVISLLDPETGLRSLALKFPGDVAEVEIYNPEILHDIDTKNDYLNELNNQKS